jgi:hypothetical protein
MLLKPYFEKFVEAFKEDFTKHDRKSLDPRKGVNWAVSGMRKCGTDLITDRMVEFTDTDKLDDVKSSLAVARNWMFEGSNEHYFICEFGKVRQCSRTEAIEFFDIKSKKVCDQVAA